MKKQKLTASELLEAFRAGLEPPYDIEDIYVKYSKGSKVYVRTYAIEGYITGMIIKHDPFNLFIKVKTPYFEELFYPEELEV